jgi:PAS domain S-box-containing protein
MPAQNFYIALYDEKEDLLSFPYFVDEVDAPAPPQKPGRGLTEYVQRTGKSLLCDRALDEEMQRRGQVDLVGTSSPIWLGVPLIVEGKAIGVMTVQHYTDPNAYGLPEQQVLEFVSSQIARAIDKIQAEEALRESEQKFRTLFEESKDGIFISTPEGRLIDVNPAGVALFGYGSKDALLKSDIGRDLYAKAADRESFKRDWTCGFVTTSNSRSSGRMGTPERARKRLGRQGYRRQNRYYQGFVRITERKRLENNSARRRNGSIGTLAGIARFQQPPRHHRRICATRLEMLLSDQGRSLERRQEKPSTARPTSSGNCSPSPQVGSQFESNQRQRDGAGYPDAPAGAAEDIEVSTLLHEPMPAP